MVLGPCTHLFHFLCFIKQINLRKRGGGVTENPCGSRGLEHTTGHGGIADLGKAGAVMKYHSSVSDGTFSISMTNKDGKEIVQWAKGLATSMTAWA